ALVAARHSALSRRAGVRPDRWVVVVGATAHASVEASAEVMDAEVVVVGGPGERLTGAALGPVLAAHGDRVCAVVATAGSTNLGLVDDLASVADACGEAGVWLHVDGAYGLAALAAPSARPRFAGVERADSLIVDPHKWLFAPFDTCVLLYRDPSWAKAVHAQHGAYLEVLHESGDWNPSDYAVHLTRRARGVPFWFSVAAYGTRAYTDALEGCLAVARAAADRVRAAPDLELVVEPELSVVAFRRLGWSPDDYVAWSRRLLESGLAFVVPSTHAGQTILRLCIVNPRTTIDDVDAVLATLADGSD
ncbi:MAG TPA: pyridoxal-dependent decarboxylase, partial [Acidimicrobiales bacterium]